MTIGEAIAMGIIIGMITTVVVIGLLFNGVEIYYDIIESSIERIDEHKRWLAKRESFEVSSDLKDIEDWMNKESVKEVIASKEFGVWLRHRVTAEIERKFGMAEQLKEQSIK